MLWENVRAYSIIVIEKEKGLGDYIWEVICEPFFCSLMQIQNFLWRKYSLAYYRDRN